MLGEGHLKFYVGSLEVLRHVCIRNIVRSHSQITGISIDDRWEARSVAVYQAIHTISNSQLVCGHTDSHILALFKGANLADSGDKDRAVDAATDP